VGAGCSRAFYDSKIDTFLAEIPPGYNAVADNPYTVLYTLILPYSGSDKSLKKIFSFLCVTAMNNLNDGK
jgi:hypothetical protein